MAACLAAHSRLFQTGTAALDGLKRLPFRRASYGQKIDSEKRMDDGRRTRTPWALVVKQLACQSREVADSLTAVIGYGVSTACPCKGHLRVPGTFRLWSAVLTGSNAGGTIVLHHVLQFADRIRPPQPDRWRAL